MTLLDRLWGGRAALFFKQRNVTAMIGRINIARDLSNEFNSLWIASPTCKILIIIESSYGGQIVNWDAVFRVSAREFENSVFYRVISTPDILSYPLNLPAWSDLILTLPLSQDKNKGLDKILGCMYTVGMELEVATVRQLLISHESQMRHQRQRMNLI